MGLSPEPWRNANDAGSRCRDISIADRRPVGFRSSPDRDQPSGQAVSHSTCSRPARRSQARRIASGPYRPPIPFGRGPSIAVVAVVEGTPTCRLRLSAVRPSVRTSAIFAWLAVDRPTGALTRVRTSVSFERLDDATLARLWQPAQYVAKFAALALTPRKSPRTAVHDAAVKRHAGRLGARGANQRASQRLVRVAKLLGVHGEPQMMDASLGLLFPIQRPRNLLDVGLREQLLHAFVANRDFHAGVRAEAVQHVEHRCEFLLREQVYLQV